MTCLIAIFAKFSKKEMQQAPMELVAFISSTLRSKMRAITVTLSSASPSALQILVKVFDQPRFKPYISTLDAYITLQLYHNHSTLLVNKET